MTRAGARFPDTHLESTTGISLFQWKFQCVSERPLETDIEHHFGAWKAVQSTYTELVALAGQGRGF